uniref:Uncharacterized protein n=1 Tax=Capra hircus TaxID=9925 RepID=A0A8C2RJW7_CAPHI
MDNSSISGAYPNCLFSVVAISPHTDMQSVLPGFFANLNWTSEEAGHSQDASGLRPFQMIFEADVKPRTLMTDSLVIKNFLRKIITVPPKIRFNFSVKVNGILSVEIFGAESEPALNLSNGIALVVNCQHYLRSPHFALSSSPGHPQGEPQRGARVHPGCCGLGLGAASPGCQGKIHSSLSPPLSQRKTGYLAGGG